MASCNNSTNLNLRDALTDSNLHRDLKVSYKALLLTQGSQKVQRHIQDSDTFDYGPLCLYKILHSQLKPLLRSKNTVTFISAKSLRTEDVKSTHTNLFYTWKRVMEAMYPFRIISKATPL